MTTSIGIKLGRALGYTGAAIAHGSIATAKATGKFGEDVLIGTTAGYAEHSERFAAQRAAIYGKRPASIAITAKAQNKATSRSFNTVFGSTPKTFRKARPEAWLALPGSTPLSPLESPSWGCKWPIGDEPFLYCCERRAKDDPAYCATHRKIAKEGM
jgi:hypothetical protein